MDVCIRTHVNVCILTAGSRESADYAVVCSAWVGQLHRVRCYREADAMLQVQVQRCRVLRARLPGERGVKHCTS